MMNIHYLLDLSVDLLEENTSCDATVQGRIAFFYRAPVDNVSKSYQGIERLYLAYRLPYDRHLKQKKFRETKIKLLNWNCKPVQQLILCGWHESLTMTCLHLALIFFHLRRKFNVIYCNNWFIRL